MKTLLLSLLLFVGAALAADDPVAIVWLDGDTFEIGEKRYRLANIDAPELDQPYGRQIAEAVAAWSFDKRLNAYGSEYDRYGRKIVELCDADTPPPHECVNDLLIEVGGAWVYEKYNVNPKLPEAERFARTNRVGLWADDNPIPPWEWRRGRRN